MPNVYVQFICALCTNKTETEIQTAIKTEFLYAAQIAQVAELIQIAFGQLGHQ